MSVRSRCTAEHPKIRHWYRVGDAARCRKEEVMRKNTLFDDYDAFVNKFEPKKTTDDCYTPEPVYAAVLKWVSEQVDIAGCNVVRPFYPGGDYENYDYRADDVVIDNPPFSILTKIVQFYIARGIRFFLFAPHLTLFNIRAVATKIVCFADIIYANKANVKTDFISNLFGDVEIMTASELKRRIESVNKKLTKTLPKYRYPDNVVTSTAFEGMLRAGIDMKIPRSATLHISALQSQIVVKKCIFGGGYLVSDAVARELSAKQEAAKQEVVVWELSEQERLVIQELNNNG